jgi:tetratricopeptide (TPR) repeat protein
MEALELLPKGSQGWFQAMTVAIAVAAFGRQHLLGELVGRLLQTGEPQASELGLPAIQAWALAANMLYMAGQYELAAEFDARIARCSEQAVQNESVAAAWVHFARHVRASYCRGDPEPTLVEATLAAGILEQSANEILVWVRIEEGKAAGLIGDFARAESLLEWAITRAADENVWAAGLARHRLAMINSFQGRHERAIELEKEAIDRFNQIAMPVMAAIGDNQLALFELARGNLELADAAIRRAHELLPAVPPLRTYGFATQARIELARGRVSEAIAALEEAEIALPSHGIINDGESVYDIAWIEALTAAGRHDEAKVRAGAAAGRLRERAERITKPEHRISYCDAVPDNARVFALEREMFLEPR